MEKEKLDELAKQHDEKWDEVLKVAEKNGFIVQAASGTAVLISNEEQIKNYGYEKYEKIQEMNNSLEEVITEEL